MSQNLYETFRRLNKEIGFRGSCCIGEASATAGLSREFSEHALRHLNSALRINHAMKMSNSISVKPPER